MFVKICGITNEDDALLAVAMGADAVGFVFAPSPRQIATQVAYDITRRLPPEILTVGVFRNELPARVVELAHKSGVKAVQLHGRETAEQCIEVAKQIRWVIKAFGSDDENLPRADQYGTDLILLSQPYRAYVKTLLERQDYPAPAATGQRPYDATGWTLPAQMGVDVRTVDRSFDLPLMSRVTASTPASSPSTTAGKIWGEKKPGYYIVDARGTAGALAGNRLLAAGLQVSWLPSPTDVNGFKYPAGSIVVPGVKEAEPVLTAIAGPMTTGRPVLCPSP